MNNPFEFVMALVAMGMVTGLLASVVRTVGRSLERKHGAATGELPQLRAEVDALRIEVAEQQDLRQRLLDLEERLDFAERLLARERGPALPKGQ
ncbi:MAG: hypothetical protein HYT81_13985 [Gemmatimonadetes bacterium]|nr:hypothetical protein [Gemmatimonadota bacterium]MBI3082554.1 hypothetical protein [Gemmatimonadota bacterium]